MDTFSVIFLVCGLLLYIYIAFYIFTKRKALKAKAETIAFREHQVTSRVQAVEERERRLEQHVAKLENEAGPLPVLPTEPEEVADPMHLLDRLDALGFEYSEPLTSGEVRCMNDDVLPSCICDEDDNDTDASCGRCCEGELRCVFAGTSTLVEGHLGNYCLSCGNGVYTNQEPPPDARIGGNLFLLLKHWTAQTASDAPVAQPIPPDLPTHA